MFCFRGHVLHNSNHVELVSLATFIVIIYSILHRIASLSTQNTFHPERYPLGAGFDWCEMWWDWIFGETIGFARFVRPCGAEQRKSTLTEPFEEKYSKTNCRWQRRTSVSANGPLWLLFLFLLPQAEHYARLQLILVFHFFLVPPMVSASASVAHQPSALLPMDPFFTQSNHRKTNQRLARACLM